MRVRPFVAVLLAGLALAAPAAAQEPTTTRASVGPGGAGGDGASEIGGVSANGRWIVLTSAATDLVAGDTNGQRDVFLRDRLTGTTRRLSAGPAGAQANGPSDQATISDDGRLVAFRSFATNLVPGGAPLGSLYVADTVAGTVRLAPPPPGGYGDVDRLAISGGGSRIVFSAFLLQPPFPRDVFVGDLGTGAVRRVSETAGGARGDGDSFDPAISADGRVVAFTTSAPDLAPGDDGTYRDIVVADLATGATERASVASGPPGALASSHSSQPALSADGCVVAFRSDAANLVTPDPGPGVTEVFSRDRCAQVTTVVSVDGAGVAGSASWPSVSADGCRVAYLGARVVPAPASGDAAVLRDRCAGTTTRLDVATSGAAGSGDVSGVRLSGTGRYAVFATPSARLVPGDGGAPADVFLRDTARNAKPVPALTADVQGRTVTADASGSADADGPTLETRLAWGDGSPESAGPRAAHEYARGGTYGVTVTVTDADGAVASTTVPVTVADPPAGTTPPPPAAGPPAPGAVAPAPLRLDRVRLRPARFRVAGRRGGARLAVRLSAAATVRVRVQRAVAGRRRGGRCVLRRAGGRRCTAWLPLATLRRALPAGVSQVPVTGRFGRRTVRPGRHRLIVDAVTADGRRSRVRTVRFTVLR